MDPLFPKLPEDLTGLSDEELGTMEKEFRSAADLILEDDPDFLGGRDADDIIAQFEAGVESIEKITAEQSARAEAQEAFLAAKTSLGERIKPKDETVEALEAEAEGEPMEATHAGEDDEDDEHDDEGAESESAEAPVLVTASADEPKEEKKTRLMRPPAPSADRVVVTEEPTPVGAPLLPIGFMAQGNSEPYTPKTLADAVLAAARFYGPAPKTPNGGGYRTGGDQIKLARAEFPFPDDRTLTGDVSADMEKIEEVVVDSIPGGFGKYSLTAAGGLCAPLTPIYSMPNFAVQDEPVWDALPKFRADRGGVNVPTPTILGDVFGQGAISTITEAEDALGGTWATKSCMDLDCPEYTETTVTILAHCREYGNLGARAWPEKIAHENALTMAALAKTSEEYMLARIKALSVNVTGGAETLGALIYLVDNIVKATFGIRSRLRMSRNARFRALMPAVLPDLLQLDTVQTRYDRFTTAESLVAYLGTLGIDPVFYIDGIATGDDQIADASQTAGALDDLPDTIQWAIYPEGAFIGLDMGSLELGIVRDSTLNSTNDFQVFGEEFRNVARLAPAQACYWVTSDLCASGQFPPVGTARTCDAGGARSEEIIG